MYFAAQYTQGVSGSTFLGIDLGSRSMPLTAVIAILYFFQSWLSMQAVAEEQRAAMKGTMYVMPLMMVFFGMSMPASVLLYWLVGGFFSIIQQLITMFIIKPKLRKQIAEEFEKNPPKLTNQLNVKTLHLLQQLNLTNLRKVTVTLVNNVTVNNS